MNHISYGVIVACAGLLAGCAASVPPTELVGARQAFLRASAGPAAQLVPAEVHKAETALALAEKSFLDEPRSFRTRDLAYIADRKAKMAEALATTAAGTSAAAKATMEYQATQDLIVKKSQADLAAAVRSDERTAQQLAAEQRARADAELRATTAQAQLATLAAVQEDERGLILTLSGSVLFASNQSALLPAAQHRLSQVADALMETKERRLVVEGHTDSEGSSSYNQQLSQRRADVVRSYIVARGYPGDLIRAQGIGKDRPIADNASAEGRANNRRVEIIVPRDSR